MGYDEAKPLCDAVQEYYGVQSRSQEDFNRLMLQQTRKGIMRMHEYLDIMKRYIDNLAIVGSPMDMRSFVSHVTTSLDEEYNVVVCVMRSKDLTLSQIQLELIAFEQRHEQLEKFKNVVSMNQVSTNRAKRENPPTNNHQSIPHSN